MQGVMHFLMHNTFFVILRTFNRVIVGENSAVKGRPWPSKG